MLVYRNLSFSFRTVKVLLSLVLLVTLLAFFHVSHAAWAPGIVKDPSPIFYPVVSFSRDGKQIGGLGGSKKGDWRISFWNSSSLSLAKTQAVSKDIEYGVLSPDFKTIAVPDHNSPIYDYLVLYDATTTRKVWRTATAPVFTIVFSPHGNFIVTSETLGHYNTSHLWHVHDGKPEPLFLNDYPRSTLDGEFYNGLAFSPDETKIVAGGENGDIALVESSSHKVIWVHTLKGGVAAVSYSPNGNLVASRVHDRVQLWEAQSGRLLHTIKMATQWVPCLKFSPDSKILASGGADGLIVLSDAQSGKQLRVLKLRSVVRSLDFSPDGATLAASYEDGTIALWRIK